jgi:hypothetical protein
MGQAQEPTMEVNVSVLERAFQLARDGKANDMKGLATLFHGGCTGAAPRRKSRFGGTLSLSKVRWVKPELKRGQPSHSISARFPAHVASHTLPNLNSWETASFQNSHI